MTDWLESINPATEAVLDRFPSATPDELETAIAEAGAAQRGWRRTSFALIADFGAGRSRDRT